MSSPARIPRPRRRRSLAGPVILIIIGLLFLLKNMGMQVPIFTIFARWWPVLLIVAGVIKIIEGMVADRTGEPATRLGGGTVFLLIMVCIFGTAASAAYLHRDEINWGEVRDEIQLDDDFMHMFGNTYAYDGELQQVVAPNTSLKIVSDRGGITVTAWEQPDLKVVWHKRLFASNQSQADSTNSNTNPQFSVAGNVITLNANTQAAGSKGISTDIEIYAPKKLALEVSAHRGDVLVNSREGDVKVDLGRGDVTAEDITGNVTADVRRGGIHADRINGNLTITGRLQDVALTEVQGYATVNGDIFGDLHLAKMAKGAKISTSRTTVEFPKLDGEMSMDSGQLQIDQAAGPLVISTRAKDLRLDSVSGDVRVNNDAGEITLDTGDKLPLGNIEIYGRHGDVHLHLPSKAQFSINASTRHGEVSSDFGGLSVSNPDHGNSVISGRIGKGGSQITVNTDSGDVSVNNNAKEGAPAATDAEASAPSVPKAPKTPKAPAPKPAEPSNE